MPGMASSPVVVRRFAPLTQFVSCKARPARPAGRCTLDGKNPFFFLPQRGPLAHFPLLDRVSRARARLTPRSHENLVSWWQQLRTGRTETNTDREREENASGTASERADGRPGRSQRSSSCALPASAAGPLGVARCRPLLERKRKHSVGSEARFGGCAIQACYLISDIFKINFFQSFFHFFVLLGRRGGCDYQVRRS